MKPLLCHGCPVLSLREEITMHLHANHTIMLQIRSAHIGLRVTKTHTNSDTPTKDMGLFNNYVWLINHYVQVQSHLEQPKQKLKTFHQESITKLNL